MSKFSQQLSQKQLLTLSLNQSMRLSLELLQMNSLQLKAYLEKELLDNPMVEVEYQEYHGGGKELIEMEDTSKSLMEELLLQLPKEASIYVIEGILQNCDRNGYLQCTIEDLAKTMKTSIAEIEQQLSYLQKCEPYGIGAKDLSDCLCIQLKQLYPSAELAYRLAQKHLEDIARGRMEKLAQRYRVSKQAVLKAVQLIRQLEPRPALPYDMEHISYIKPDAIIVNEEGQLQLRMPSYFNIKEQEYYKNNALDQADLTYIKEKRAQGKMIIECLQHRKQTLHDIMEVMILVQQDYLLRHTAKKVLRMREVADTLGVHETTISRAMKDKYYQYEGICYPMHNLLCKQVHDSSKDEVVLRMTALIEAEDPRHPLSDEVLSQLLKEEGIRCSRRTIAKYRSEHHILDSQARKRKVDAHG